MTGARDKRAWTSLAARGHAVYELAPGLLLVFKPRGHREEEHAHPQGQRLSILAGRMIVRTPRKSEVLTARRAPFSIPAGRRHATEATADTWLVVRRIRPS